VAVLFDNRLHLPLFRCPEPPFFTKNTRKTRQNSPLPPPPAPSALLSALKTQARNNKKKAFGKWSLPSFISLKPLEQQDAQPIGTSAWRDLGASSSRRPLGDWRGQLACMVAKGLQPLDFQLLSLPCSQSSRCCLLAVHPRRRNVSSVTLTHAQCLEEEQRYCISSMSSKSPRAQKSAFGETSPKTANVEVAVRWWARGLGSSS